MHNYLPTTPFKKYVWIAIAIIIVDRLTKSWALTLHDDKIINSFVLFSLTFNRGINWGFFNSTSQMQFVAINCIIALVIVALVVYTYFCSKMNEKLLPHTLILAGAFSNFFDRILYGGVIDFIVLSINDFSWPAFNGADVCILSGIAVLVYNNFQQ